MTIKLSLPQAVCLRAVKNGEHYSPPLPPVVMEKLEAKGLVVHVPERGSRKRYDLTEEGERF